jgi:hypothetical protein
MKTCKIPDAQYEQVEELVSVFGTNSDDVLRRAIKLLHVTVGEIRRGNSIAYCRVSDGKIEAVGTGFIIPTDQTQKLLDRHAPFDKLTVNIDSKALKLSAEGDGILLGLLEVSENLVRIIQFARKWAHRFLRERRATVVTLTIDDNYLEEINAATPTPASEA